MSGGVRSGVLASLLIVVGSGPMPGGPAAARPSPVARPDTLVPLVRLADEEARAQGWRDPVTATVAQVTRPLVGESDTRPIEVRVAGPKPKTDAKGHVTIEVHCPAELPALHRIDVALNAIRIPPEVHRRRLPQLCAGHADEWRPVRLDGAPPEVPVYATAIMLAPPARRVESVPVTVPLGAELRLALGVRTEGTARAVRARVLALAPGRPPAELAAREIGPGDVAAGGGWIAWRIPLAAARRDLGPAMRFAFEADAPFSAAGFRHVLWGDPTIYGPRPRPRAARERNVVLISLDTLRADRLGAAGYPLAITPNLDRLAREGTMFTDAVSSANWTKPSHATMLTGTHPCVHGVDWGGGGLPGPLPAGIVPLAEWLRQAGWATAAFTEDAYVSPDVFQRGFGSFAADEDAHVQGVIERTMASATAWIEANAARPFFAFVHTYQVHEPYTPPAEYQALASMPAVPSLPGLPAPAESSMRDAAAYIGEVAYTDAVVGRFLDRLDALGLRATTIVVVTSDHGEAFGEHRARFHGTSLHREQIRVPLIVRAPGLVAAGRRIDDMVGLVDLAPTVLDLLGFERPLWMQGISLAGAIRADSHERVLLGRAIPIRGIGKLSGVRGATWKLKRNKPPRYWDLRSDPGERRGFPPPARTLATLSSVVDSACRRGRERVAAAGAGRQQRAAGQVSPEQRAKLRALGYAE